MLKRLKYKTKIIYEKLLLINDSPQKVSLGLGLGVSLGIIPGTGPIAAVTLAVLFGLNRISALIGSLMVNTWLSVITLTFAVKLGARLFSLDWHKLYANWLAVFTQFQIKKLFSPCIYSLILPTFIGYVIISFVCGFLTYLICILILTRARYGNSG